MTFYQVITAAVADITEHGFQSAERIAYWQEQIRLAAERSTESIEALTAKLQQSMAQLYANLVDRDGILKYHPGISRFTLERIKPILRPELDRRIMASANLIRLNRQEAISNTLRRFTGWATSIPQGGSDTVDKNPLKTNIRKSMAQLPFEERRVIIDQNSKLRSAINAVVAQQSAAIAAQWHSHWRDASYDYRPDHKARDLKWYLIRDSWAQQQGLVKPTETGYSDAITQPGEAVFCRCNFTYAYALGRLPPEMLTRKGQDALASAKAAMAA